MPSLQIREVPEHVYRALKDGSKRENRSLSKQAIAVLSRGLRLHESPRERRMKLLREIADSPKIKNAHKLPDPVKLIREDRDR